MKKPSRQRSKRFLSWHNPNSYRSAMSVPQDASAPPPNSEETPERLDRSEANSGDDSAPKGQAMTQKEWIQAMNRANPLDRHLSEKKAFESEEPPEEAIKLYRDGRTRYLLNVSRVDITRLRYRKWPGHRQKRVEPAPADAAVERVPARSFVAIEDGFDPNVDTSTFALSEVEWADGTSFEGPRRLKEYNPVTASLRSLDLTRIEREVKPVDDADRS